MIDSTNPRQLADNIRKLWDKFKSISADLLPSRSTATTGQILKLTGENKTPSWADEYSYTPPAYSTTETATGQKWIDGKEVYFISYSGKSPEAGNLLISFNFDTILYAVGTIVNNANSYFYDLTKVMTWLGLSDKSGVVVQASTAPGYQNTDFNIVIFFTKPDPTPGNREPDQEPEEPEKKTTKKKTK